MPEERISAMEDKPLEISRSSDFQPVCHKKF